MENAISSLPYLMDNPFSLFYKEKKDIFMVNPWNGAMYALNVNQTDMKSMVLL